MAITALLIDIEGTTVPIQFVHGSMFQYAKDCVENFIRHSCDSEELKNLLKEIETEFNRMGEISQAVNLECNEGSIVFFSGIVKKLIDKDSKFWALKELEGQIWKEGFEKGALKCELYPDVKENVQKWKNAGKRIFIYSSGSVLSQKLLFSHTSEGDVSQMIDGYFDTKVGNKKSKKSYSRIANLIGKSERDILFLSDSEEEIMAAESAGMQCYLVKRDVNDNHKFTGFRVINNFEELAI